MTAQSLGRLERVELRDIWTSESAGFTPWLARPENLAVLGGALGMDLELEAQEHAVGPFRADILCKDVGADHWVLIENQLEKTDHSHLGQLLTYAAGLEAVTIIWIAARFTEEHRATLDWLNRITDESVRFFGLEVELWRIGTSLAAPNFKIVSKPNDWSHAVSNAARAIDDQELTGLKAMQKTYWERLNGILDLIRGSVRGNRTPRASHAMPFPVGRSRFHLAGVMLRQRDQVRAELYIKSSNAKAFFHLLRAQKPDIERELGYALEWEELPERQECRIAVYLAADPDDVSDWPRQHQWLAERLNELHKTFSPRVAVLDAETWQPPPG